MTATMCDMSKCDNKLRMPHHYRGQHTRGGRHSNDSACCRSGTIRICCAHLFTRHRCAPPGSSHGARAWQKSSTDRWQRRVPSQGYTKTHLRETWAREIICFNQLALTNWMRHYRAHTTKGQTSMLTAFLDARPAVVAAIADLGVGAEPSAEVVRGCEEFLCVLFCPTSHRLMLSMAPL